MGTDDKSPWGGDKDNNPWGSGNKNPWGEKKESSSSSPNVEDLFKSRRKSNGGGGFNFGGGGGGDINLPFNKGSIGLLVLVLFVVWMLSGFYQVEPNQQGVVLRFGEYVATTPPGLHYHLPYPIESHEKPLVTYERKENIGYVQISDGQGGYTEKNNPQESLMLTGDENNVDIHFSVFWNVKDAADYLFNMRDPAGTVKIAAESAMREIIGQRKIQDALTAGKEEIQEATKNTLQKVLDEFKSGIRITKLTLLKVDPPRQVVDAFNEVQRAKAEKERLRNQAEGYRNSILPEARGQAFKLIEEAEGYKVQKVEDARGDANRFLAVYKEYKNAKEVTARKIYLEAMEEILAGTNKVIIDPSSKGTNVLPYLPLEGLKNTKGGQR